MQDIAFTVHIFREGDLCVAHVPELDVSSCGKTTDEARRNIEVHQRQLVFKGPRKNKIDRSIRNRGAPYARFGQKES